MIVDKIDYQNIRLLDIDNNSQYIFVCNADKKIVEIRKECNDE